jgi:hypothetical protein
MGRERVPFNTLDGRVIFSPWRALFFPNGMPASCAQDGQLWRCLQGLDFYKSTVMKLALLRLFLSLQLTTRATGPRAMSSVFSTESTATSATLSGAMPA